VTHRPTGRRALALLAGLLTAAATLAVTAPLASANAQAPAGHCSTVPAPGDSPTSKYMDRNTRVVVMVHGWDGEPKSWDKMIQTMSDQHLLPRNVVMLRFNYAADSYHWAAVPAIADCLAQYIHRVTMRLAEVDADQRVLVVTHSMGGLATRFAMDSRYTSDPVTKEVAGVVTLDTPHLGSPFGSQTVARAMEGIKHPVSLWPAKAGTDGSICLALHDQHTALPAGCATAPYLPSSIPLTQVAGEASVARSLFGFRLYDIDLASDGIVGSDSSSGYVGSGRVGLATPSGSHVVHRRVSCTVPLEKMLDAATDAGFLPTGVKALVAAATSTLSLNTFTSGFNDEAAFEQLTAGKIGPEVLRMLVAATVAAPCSHINLQKDEATIKVTAEALRGYLADMAKSDGGRAAIEPFAGGWHRHRTEMSIGSDGSVIENGDDYIASHVKPAGDRLLGQIESVDHPVPEIGWEAGSRLEIIQGPLPNVITVNYGVGPGTSTSLQFCRDGVNAPPGNECGA